jgi:aryl-phospho-beta-D-glucosidase BglC (GH1 family)
VFVGADDIALLADLGVNCVRVPVHYRILEDDDQPFTIRDDAFGHLDRVIRLCAERRIYTIIDLHAVPGSQNHHWHSDNPSTIPLFWVHRHFQDRVVHLWEAIADHYRDDAWVGGYNLLNEPADEGGERLAQFYDRACMAVRAIDRDHILFLDGNTYATDFSMFRDPLPNTVYTCHDYAPPGLVSGGPYPGHTKDVYWDQAAVERKFLERTAFARKTGTPVWIGEFGPQYTGDPVIDRQRDALLGDQLDIYDRYGASWSLWTYKDIGFQGVVTVSPGTPYRRLFGPIVGKKARLGTDRWTTTGAATAAVIEPVQQLVAREFPDFDPYPWGARDWVTTLLNQGMLAEAMVDEYARAFAGLDDTELIALADSFALSNCVLRPSLAQRLRDHHS